LLMDTLSEGSSQRTQRRTTKGTTRPERLHGLRLTRPPGPGMIAKRSEESRRRHRRLKRRTPAPSCPLWSFVFVVMNLQTRPLRRRQKPLKLYPSEGRFPSQFRTDSLYAAGLGATRIRVPETVRSRRPDCRLHRPSRRAFHRPNS
jgi:hypothetical protein